MSARRSALSADAVDLHDERRPMSLEEQPLVHDHATVSHRHGLGHAIRSSRARRRDHPGESRKARTAAAGVSNRKRGLQIDAVLLGQGLQVGMVGEWAYLPTGELAATMTTSIRMESAIA